MTQGYGAVDTRVGKTAGGKYRLVRLLGSGGMGEVYEAQHSGIGRRFAIKFLHPLLAGNTEIVARFQREAQAAGGRHHLEILQRYCGSFVKPGVGLRILDDGTEVAVGEL